MFSMAESYTVYSNFSFFILYSWILDCLIIYFYACQIFVEVNSYDVYKLIFSIDESHTE